MAFNPAEFGELLRELRGAKTQTEVERESGVPQHRISAFERGEVQDPGILVLLQLTAYYGLSPNETAALLGVYALDEAESEQFPPDVARDLEAVRNYMLKLETPPRQRRFGQMLQDAIAEMKELVERDELLSSSRLPDFIRKKVQRPIE